MHIIDQNCIVFFKLFNDSCAVQVQPALSCPTPHHMYIDVVILDILLPVWRRRECHIGVFVRRVSSWDILDWTRSKTAGRMCNVRGTIRVYCTERSPAYIHLIALKSG